MSGLGGAPTKEGELGSIGGTSFAKIVGLNKYNGPHSVWSRVLGYEKPTPAGPYAERGVRLEPVVAQLAEEALCSGQGLFFRDPRETTQRWPEPYSMFTASIDKVMWDKTDMVGPVELKTMNSRRKWEGRGPDEYICQLQSYIWFNHLQRIEDGHEAGCNDGYLVCLHADEGALAMIKTVKDAKQCIDQGVAKLHIEHFERDNVFKDVVMEEALRFWNEHVLTKTPPPANGSKECAEVFRDFYGIQEEMEIVAGDKLTELALRREQLRKAINVLLLERAVTDNKIREELAGASIAENKKVKITQKMLKGAKRFNRKLFAKEFPELDEKYTEEGKPSTKLTIKLEEDT